MKLAHRRHDIRDEIWDKIEDLLPGKVGKWGGRARDNRTFINAVLWIIRTGAPWRDLPPDYGDWKNTQRRFCRWRNKGVWENILQQFIIDPDYEWLIHIHQSSSLCGRSKRWQSKDEPYKRGLNTKVHLAVDAYGMPVRIRRFLC